MITPWIKDPIKWEQAPLVDKLEELRKHYCTGPCGQSSSVISNRSTTNKTLREAIETINRLQSEIDSLYYNLSMNGDI